MLRQDRRSGKRAAGGRPGGIGVSLGVIHTGCIPAAWAPTPSLAQLSPTYRHCSGATDSSAAACRNGAGSGLRVPMSRAHATVSKWT
ncbi:hypothetical protein ADL27_56610 [Streptomyces sp. NRRL F-6602]|nr:hypothetical protein ADL27_56610 [Streptomyces sp. NRRL F-6602]